MCVGGYDRGSRVFGGSKLILGCGVWGVWLRSWVGRLAGFNLYSRFFGYIRGHCFGGKRPSLSGASRR